MCNILYQPKGITLADSHFINSHDWNPHGRGIAFPGGDNGIQIIKSMTLKLDAVINMHRAYSASRPVISHFRYATKGEKIVENCHPFEILSRKEDGFSLVGFHNGTIRQVTVNGQFSDTYLFFNEYLRPILKQNRALIHKVEFQHLLSQILGFNNKLLFLEETGNVVIINRNQGTELHTPNKINAWASTGRYLEVKPTSVDRTGSSTTTSSYYGGTYRKDYSANATAHGVNDNVEHIQTYRNSISRVSSPSNTSNVSNIREHRKKNTTLDVYEESPLHIGWRKARSQKKHDTITERLNLSSFAKLFQHGD